MLLIYTPVQVSFQGWGSTQSNAHRTAKAATEMSHNGWWCHCPSHWLWQARGVGDQDTPITKKAFYLNYSTVPVHSLTIMSRMTMVYFRRLDQLGDVEQFPNFFPSNIMPFLCRSKSNPVQVYFTLKALLGLQAALTEEQTHGKSDTDQWTNPLTSYTVSTNTELCLEPKQPVYTKTNKTELQASWDKQT